MFIFNRQSLFIRICKHLEVLQKSSATYEPESSESA